MNSSLKGMTMTLEFPTPKIISASWRKIYMESKKKKKRTTKMTFYLLILSF
jgi:hypothetical protein